MLSLGCTARTYGRTWLKCRAIIKIPQDWPFDLNLGLHFHEPASILVTLEILTSPLVFNIVRGLFFRLHGGVFSKNFFKDRAIKSEFLPGYPEKKTTTPTTKDYLWEVRVKWLRIKIIWIRHLFLFMWYAMFEIITEVISKNDIRIYQIFIHWVMTNFLSNKKGTIFNFFLFCYVLGIAARASCLHS